MDERSGLEIASSIHYDFFMRNPRFWYDRDLRDADKLVCLAMSDLRRPEAASLLETEVKKMRKAKQ